ncbi:hypothetical protein ACA910_010274 [Epithemia clementina (nom. ined.)]
MTRGSCEKDDCWNFFGDGTCTLCQVDKAGRICEHHVCRDSYLGAELANETATEPADFDFARYGPEEMNILQESQADGDFVLSVGYSPVSLDLKEHRLRIDGKDVGVASTFSAYCQENSEPSRAIMQYVLNSPNVGATVGVCLRGIWKDSVLALTGGSWSNLTL